MEAILNPFTDFGEHYLPEWKLIIREFASGAIEMVQKPVNFIRELDNSRDHGIRGAAHRLEKTAQQIEDSKDENLRRAERRARQNIRFKILSIGADHLLTLTYRDNVTDSDKLNDDFTRFIRLVREKYPDYQYVAVKEFQERGALHMHVAVVGKQDIPFLRASWYAALGRPGATGEDSPGQVDVRYKKKRFSGQSPVFSAVQLAGYLSKYISKTFDTERELGARRYKSSRGIPAPKVQRIYLGATSGQYGKDALPMAIKSTLDHADLMGLDVGDYQLWMSSDMNIVVLRGAAK